ncbi:hypothetical protein ACFSFW_12965 [Fredinandcohnia salidurans]|uniref:PH domain-containing protein n=1 Tax=Fredinandcohnia salidurans TaxID=2595041 RepID=A0ABW4MNI7_9BACI|nr:hypothetical protein [Fredinandcohnia onubensis]
MGKTTNRFVVNAVGKDGEIYLTHCRNKEELKGWLASHEKNLIMDELKVIDKKPNPLLKLFGSQKNN